MITILDEVSSLCIPRSSTRTLAHYSQLATNGGRFAKYDFGKEGNMVKYGQETAPDYDLSKVGARISKFKE